MRQTIKAISLFKRDGIALVLTLMAVSFMVAITVQLFSSVNRQMESSANLRDSVMLDAMNYSGLSLARAALLADQRENKFDSLFDSWHSLDREKLSGVFGHGKLSVEVTDLSGRLQVNALISTEKEPQKSQQEQAQYDLWRRFLTSGLFAIDDQEQAETIIQSIQDWIDKDDNEREKGAENGYYQSLPHPYAPANGPVLYLEELLLIRGMTRDIFYGNEDHPGGLAQYLTVAGRDGKININSAPKEILQVLAPGMDEEMANKMIEFRQDPDNRDMLQNPGWCTQFVFGGVQLDQKLLTVISSAFRITSTATYSGVTRTGEGLILRNTDESQQLESWEVR